MITKDVLIVGGGPAGSACAWRLRQHDLTSLVLDRAAFPRAKPCAGWITPSVFTSLQITPDAYPYTLTKFGSFQISIRGWKFKLPTHQYAIRRTEFDTWLLNYAAANLVQHNVTHIEKNDDGYMIDGQYCGKYLVGAGGTHCPVLRKFFTAENGLSRKNLIIALEEEFSYPFKDQRCFLWFFEEGLPGYAWYVPKVGGILNVGIGGNAAGLRRKGMSLKNAWQKHINALNMMGLVEEHTFNPSGYSYYLRQEAQPTRRENALLAGDALGLATRDMGEGIAPAIQSGILAADAINQGCNYSIINIPRFSFPSLLRLRTK